MKIAILFVDDEVQLIEGLKRSMRTMAKEWDLFFASSGEEALNILSQNQIHIIVTDLRMPGMDGSVLLEKVSGLYPQVIRFVLSGQSDQQMALKASRVTHQVLAKPCDSLKLQQAIQRSLQLRHILSAPRFVKVITGIKKLPSLPAIYNKLVHEMESPNVSAKSLGDIIAQDVTMTAKVLQLVNTAFYGLPNEISNPQRAVTILGINVLKSLVLSQEVFSKYQGRYNPYFSIDNLWIHSQKVGGFARVLAQRMELDSSMVDDANVAGMMHDIGRLILLDIPGFYEELVRLVKQGMPALTAEYRILDTSHAELGAYLLGLWGLPDSVVQAVAFHHLPSKQVDLSLSPLTDVHIANAFVESPKTITKDNITELLDMKYLQALGLDYQLPVFIKSFQNFNN